ncbi:MAG: class I SAM-dependent methyltransferase [Chloroflexota bacterium]
MTSGQLSASFRDPNGFLFTREGLLYRQINTSYAENYALLMESGLYEKLIKANLLISHTEVSIPPAEAGLAHKIIQPEYIPFISYPYEWSFSQLKDAALATLAVQKRSLKAGLTLKDASAYNIQFQRSKAVLIDSLSFEIYHEGEPWVAYKQFCQHFLAPLALMAKTDIRLSQLLRIYIDGVPLDLASRLLPLSSHFNFGLLTHLHLHAQVQTRYADKAVQHPAQTKSARMSLPALLALIDNLSSTVKKLEWTPAGTEWGNYYKITNYSNSAFEHKKSLVTEWVTRVAPQQVWDLGANNGEFTRLASGQNIQSIAFDIDPAAVEQNYRQVKKTREDYILPLIMDLANPSPALGWHNRERESLSERAPTDMVLALAIIHHLAISNNVPLPQLADFFYDMGKWLVIEFVPKSDSQVKILLTSRPDIFDHYCLEDFEQVFSSRFEIVEKINVRDSDRYLYLMHRRAA